MSYLDIDNLYKAKDILMLKECYAMEKVHGTSAHISWNAETQELKFFSGGASHILFIALFNEDLLRQKFIEIGCKTCTVYGEAYGGKVQKMSDVYGKDLQFVVFEVKMSDKWLNVPQSEQIAQHLGIEFVPYERISTDIDKIDAERDRESIIAIRRGCGNGKRREGVVLRPLIELTKNNGGRIIAKHKQDWAKERQNVPKVDDPEKMKILSMANAIADEWCTEMRLTHVLDGIPQPWGMEQCPLVMKAMVADIEKEAKGEIVSSKEAHKAINRKTATMFEQRLKDSLRQ